MSLIILPHFGFCDQVKISRIIDGDTFIIENGERVRLIGINAPEISDIFGLEAKQHLQLLIGGKFVELLPDNLSKDRDRYNRLLRYIIFKGNDINKQMVLDGYAIAYLKYHFVKSSEYRNAQITSNLTHSGMWSSGSAKQLANIHPSKHAQGFSKFFNSGYLLMLLVLLLFGIGLWSYFSK